MIVKDSASVVFDGRRESALRRYLWAKRWYRYGNEVAKSGDTTVLVCSFAVTRTSKTLEAYYRGFS